MFPGNLISSIHRIIGRMAAQGDILQIFCISTARKLEYADEFAREKLRETDYTRTQGGAGCCCGCGVLHTRRVD